MKLADDKYYVGESSDVKKRIWIHKNKSGSAWTKKYDYVDMRVAHEGEVSFSNILKVVLENGIQNRDKIFSDKINGCIYLNRKTNELIEAKQERLHSLGLIPSPYTTGLLDEFFDGHLSPSLQTHRGCPFKCNFCNCGKSTVRTTH